MPKLKVAIVDDEQDARDNLAGLLELYCEDTVEVIGQANSLATALKLVKSTQLDLVFLDIRLGDDHGFDLLKNIENPAFQTVFVTGDDNFAVDAFRVSAVDYLLKPVIPEDLENAVNKVISLKEKGNIETQIQNIASALPDKEEEKIVISTQEAVHLIDTRLIINIKGEAGYSTFFTQDEGKILASKSLSHYEKILSKTLFFRTHQSHLVNLNFIKSILPAQDCVCLKNGEEIPLSRQKKKELTELLKTRFKF